MKESFEGPPTAKSWLLSSADFKKILKHFLILQNLYAFIVLVAYVFVLKHATL